MATFNEIIYDVREAIKEYTDDSEISDRYIAYLIHIKRSKFLKQKLNKFNRRFNNKILQSLCLEVESVSANECSINLNCDKILRTKRPLPELIQLSDKDAIERISPSTMLSKKFNFITREKASFLNNAYNTKSVKTFLDTDDYLYFISSQDLFLECVTVKAVFENPIDLMSYTNCCNCNNTDNKCIDYDSIEYPVELEMIDLIREDIIKDLLRTKQIPEDKINDSND